MIARVGSHLALRIASRFIGVHLTHGENGAPCWFPFRGRRGALTRLGPLAVLRPHAGAHAVRQPRYGYPRSQGKIRGCPTTVTDPALYGTTADLMEPCIFGLMAPGDVRLNGPPSADLRFGRFPKVPWRIRSRGGAGGQPELRAVPSRFVELLRAEVDTAAQLRVQAAEGLRKLSSLRRAPRPRGSRSPCPATRATPMRPAARCGQPSGRSRGRAASGNRALVERSRHPGHHHRRIGAQPTVSGSCSRVYAVPRRA